MCHRLGKSALLVLLVWCSASAQSKPEQKPAQVEPVASVPTAQAPFDCCATGHGAGCSDPTIQNCVCALDSFCCDVEWTQSCVDEVSLFGCGACSGLEACCLPSGCSDEFPSDCILLGGEPQGPGSSCAAGACLPTVACCLGGECLDLFFLDCALPGGFPYPDGSACGDPQIDCTDCNGNGVPDNIELAEGSATDINTNAVPDDCEQDLNENGIPDEWEIAQGSVYDLDTNGIPDLVDILACRYDDMNYNGKPDSIEIAEGSATDANSNGVIDEAEQPAGEHSAGALLRRLPNGTLLADSNGVPIKYMHSNGVIIVDPMGNPIPDPNGLPFIDFVRDDELAAKLKAALIDTSGPMPVSRVKDAKIFVQSCFGAGMLDDLDEAFGGVVRWVGGSASRSDEVAHADPDGVPDPAGHWVKPLIDAMSNGLPVLQALKHASRDSASSPVNKPHMRTQDHGVYRRGHAGGESDITLEDPTAASHHALFIAGITDQQGIENEITKMCALLKEQWGDLNTTGTSVHLVYGAGTKNPCAGSGVPDGNVRPATFQDVCDAIDALAPDLGPNEEFVLFIGDHGLGTEKPVNTNAFRARGVEPPALHQSFTLSFATKHGITRDPNNQAFIRVVASGTYSPGTVSVSVNGFLLGYLNPAALNDAGLNENEVPVPDSLLRVGKNTLTVDPQGAAVIVLDTEFLTGALGPVPVPGWGDANGDFEVDLADLPDFTACLSGPGGGYIAPACQSVDIDLDGDVDLRDVRLLQEVFTGGL
ncbi:MAG TPA: hypothetical protein P5572_16600 [Phycisphaerae bacterium]|nr:hypothetical protein [Phycisphaerales bacterium]HRX86645.1 hypothetical protein [Phycisphaerae bacterium]